MLLGVMRAVAGTHLHLSNEKESEATLSLDNNLIHVQSAAARKVPPASSVSLRVFIVLLVKVSGLQKAIDEEGIEGKIALWYLFSLPKKTEEAVVSGLFKPYL